MARFEESLAKDVYRQLKTDILCGNIKDGDFITLNELEKRFSVSKTPIRDALSALEIEGYLKVLPRKGYLVSPVTQNHVREYFQMRLILEVAAVELAVKTADDYELKGIVCLTEKFPRDDKEGGIFAFNELNNAFHLAIVAATHNSVMKDVFSGILENLSRILMADSRNLDILSERDEHIAIAQAMFERNSERAAALTKAHIVKLLDRVYSTQWGILNSGENA